MGKKKPEEMAAQRERFVQGAVKNGYPPKKFEKIFDLMASSLAMASTNRIPRHTLFSRITLLI